MLPGGHLLGGKSTFLENVPGSGTSGKNTEMSTHFLLSPHSCVRGPLQSSETLMEKRTDQQKLWCHGTRGSNPSSFFHTSCLNGLVPGMILWGHVIDYEMSQNWPLAWFRGKVWRDFLLNALIGGIFLATYYKHFMECGWFLCRLPPLSTVFILHFWYPGLLSIIKGMFPLEKMMLL